MKRIAIVQSNYIPWKGYFDLIASVDEFVVLDDVQYTRRDWRNRNLIKTPDGLRWLTVPVHVAGRYTQTIRETRISDAGWSRRHWDILRHNYRRAAHFEWAAGWIEPLYRAAQVEYLSDLNGLLIDAICARLRIGTKIVPSTSYRLNEDRVARLADICEQAGADAYVSGPSARDYLATDAFAARGMRVEWFAYDGYPEYTQLWGAFAHGVSIVDLFFNCGPEAARYMKHVPR